jgi:hypothetical protein
MTLPTVAEAKAIDARRVDGIGRSSLVASASADGAQNLVGVTSFNLESAAANVNHSMRDFISPIIPTVAAYTAAKIGDKFLVPLVSSAETSNPYDYEEYVYTQNGMEKILTETMDKALCDFKAVADGADTALAVTAAMIAGGIVIGTPTAARSYQLPTGTELLAQFPRAKIGSAIRFTVVNLAAATYAITLVAGVGFTNGGIAAHLGIAAATSQSYIAVFTGITTPTAVLYPA